MVLVAMNFPAVAAAQSQLLAKRMKNQLQYGLHSTSATVAVLRNRRLFLTFFLQPSVTLARHSAAPPPPLLRFVKPAAPSAVSTPRLASLTEPGAPCGETLGPVPALESTTSSSDAGDASPTAASREAAARSSMSMTISAELRGPYIIVAVSPPESDADPAVAATIPSPGSCSVDSDASSLRASPGARSVSTVTDCVSHLRRLVWFLPELLTAATAAGFAPKQRRRSTILAMATGVAATATREPHMEAVGQLCSHIRLLKPLLSVPDLEMLALGAKMFDDVSLTQQIPLPQSSDVFVGDGWDDDADDLDDAEVDRDSTASTGNPYCVTHGVTEPALQAITRIVLRLLQASAVGVARSAVPWFRHEFCVSDVNPSRGLGWPLFTLAATSLLFTVRAESGRSVTWLLTLLEPLVWNSAGCEAYGQRVWAVLTRLPVSVRLRAATTAGAR